MRIIIGGVLHRNFKAELQIMNPFGDITTKQNQLILTKCCSLLIIVFLPVLPPITAQHLLF